MKHSGGPPTPGPGTRKTENVQKETSCQRFTCCLRHKIFRASIFALLAAMAFWYATASLPVAATGGRHDVSKITPVFRLSSVISITAVYLVNLTEEDFGSAPNNR